MRLRRRMGEVLVLASLGLAQTGPAARADERAPGIYAGKVGEAESKAERIDPGRAETQVKGVAKTMLTGGLLKPKLAQAIGGAQATLRLSPDAVFYFQFDPRSDAPMGQPADLASAMEMMGRMNQGMPLGAKKPDEFSLVRLEVKTEERVLVMAMGGKVKNAVSCAVERTSPFSYRIVPAKPLLAGEYAFVHRVQGGGGDGMVWEFGVDER